MKQCLPKPLRNWKYLLLNNRTLHSDYISSPFVQKLAPLAAETSESVTDLLKTLFFETFLKVLV